MSLNIKTFAALVSEALARIGVKSLAIGKPITNFNTGSIIRTMTEVVSQPVSELYAYGAEMLKQSFMDSATGIWLQYKVKEFNKEKKAAVKTTGMVKYKRKVARNTNITIEANSIVGTKKDRQGNSFRYFTTAEAILEAGQTMVPVPIIAEFAGKAYNVEAGTIVEMRTFIAGIDEVTNELDWITRAGADEEKDDSLRQRGFLAWEELAGNGPKDFYKSIALGVPGVSSAWVDDNNPRGEGTIDVYVLGESGPPLPGSALIVAVQSAIDARRAPGADVRVYPPSTVAVGPWLTVTPLAGYDTVALATEIRRRLRIMFTLEDKSDTDSFDIPILGAGLDVVVAQIVHVVMGVPGVYSVSPTAFTITREGAPIETIRPAVDIVIDADEFPTLSDIIINFTAASYERQ